MLYNMDNRNILIIVFFVVKVFNINYYMLKFFLYENYFYVM